MSNYFINRDSKSGEVTYLEYDISKGYEVKPKVKKKDAIEVNKIVFVSPSFSEKIIKKKIDHKISKLLLELNTSDDDNGDGSEGARVRDSLREAERLKLNIIKNYSSYLGKSYLELTLEKLEIIIDALRKKLYNETLRKNQRFLMEMFNGVEEKKGRGR